jgi:large subunit ribosomal protein L15
MDILTNLTPVSTKKNKRVGRGYGSGVGGHTTGRGAKGDKVRGKTKITFDGTKIKKGWIKRTPFLRGKHRTLKRSETLVFNFDQLEKWFKAGDTVDVATIVKVSGADKKYATNVKILSRGKLTKAVNIKGISLSKTAQAKITALGGKID